MLHDKPSTQENDPKYEKESITIYPYASNKWITMIETKD